MSFKVITNLINFVKDNLNVDEDNIIIKNIEIDDNCEYTMKIEIKDNLYAIKHYEPLHTIKGINYGMGPWYDCYWYNEEQGHYIKLKF